MIMLNFYCAQSRLLRRSQLLKDIKHDLARFAHGLERNGPRESEPGPFGHVNFEGGSNRAPVEALDQCPQDQPQSPQRQGLSGTLAPPPSRTVALFT